MNKWIHSNKKDNLTVNTGWNLRDVVYLSHYDSPQKNPDMQLFISSDEEENEEEKEYFCPKCSSLLDRVSPNIEKWICRYCSTVVDSWTFDKPLVTSKESNLRVSYGQKGNYPVYDSEDDIPFFRSFGPNQETEDNSPYEMTYSTPDKRIAHIRMKPGVSPAEYNIREELVGGGIQYSH